MQILIGLFLCFAYVNCKIFRECNGRPSRTYVPSYNKNGCRSFIYCNGDNSFEDMCSIGFVFNPIELSCDPRDIYNCDDDDIELNNNVSPTKSSLISSKIVTAMTKQHPTPPGKPLRTTPPNPSTMNSTPSENSNRPVPTRKNLGSSTFRPKTPSKPIRTNTPPKTSKPTRRTESPINIPTPPGPAQNIPNQSKKPILTTLPKETEPTWLPTESTSYVSSTKFYPKTKATSSSSATPTTERYQTEQLTSSTVRSEIATNIQEQCSKKKVGSFAYPGDCHYYYRCIKGNLNKEECPRGFGWDAKSKMCTSKGCSK